MITQMMLRTQEVKKGIFEQKKLNRLVTALHLIKWLKIK